MNRFLLPLIFIFQISFAEDSFESEQYRIANYNQLLSKERIWVSQENPDDKDEKFTFAISPVGFSKNGNAFYTTVTEDQLSFSHLKWNTQDWVTIGSEYAVWAGYDEDAFHVAGFMSAESVIKDLVDDKKLYLNQISEEMYQDRLNRVKKLKESGFDLVYMEHSYDDLNKNDRIDDQEGKKTMLFLKGIQENENKTETESVTESFEEAVLVLELDYSPVAREFKMELSTEVNLDKILDKM